MGQLSLPAPTHSVQACACVSGREPTGCWIKQIVLYFRYLSAAIGVAYIIMSIDPLESQAILAFSTLAWVAIHGKLVMLHSIEHCSSNVLAPNIAIYLLAAVVMVLTTFYHDTDFVFWLSSFRAAFLLLSAPLVAPLCLFSNKHMVRHKSIASDVEAQATEH